MQKRLPSRVLTLGLLGFIGLTACHKDSPPTKAPSKVEESFSIIDKQSTDSGGSLGLADNKIIRLEKSSLDKEFLFQASIIQQIPVPTSHGLKSRVVAFHREGSDVFLLEATQGHVITKDLPSQLILAKIPIMNESEKTLDLDFNRGLSAIYVAGDWTSSDEGVSYTKSFSAIDVKQSYLLDAKFVGNAVVARQIAQVQSKQLDTVELRFSLEPYAENPKFVKTPGGDLRRFGFFEVAPLYQSSLGNGKLDVYASKFDINKPIIFAISANTPEPYRQAMLDGILYWNQTLPNDPIQAIVAPEGVTAPDYEWNVVQWVPWDTAGYAYADAQMDPITGETRHAQVFMTSTFAISGEARAKAMLKKLESTRSISQAPQIALAGMEQRPLCNRASDRSFQAALEELITRNASDAEYLRLSQDYVREVVAHEVGHTLGLRHNFAGSLGANYPLAKRDAIVQQYLREDKVSDDIIPSSSVMEYQVFEESAISGHIMRQKKRALPYDSMAIQYLYLGKEPVKEEIPLFCTDSQTDHLDCKTFDIGPNPIAYRAWQKNLEEASLANTIYQSIVRNKKLGLPTTLTAEQLTARLFGDASAVYRALEAQSPLIQLRKAAGDQLSEAAAIDAEQKFMEAEIRQAGGLKVLLSGPKATSLDALPQAVRSLLRYSKDPNPIFNLEEQIQYEESIQALIPQLKTALAMKIWTQFSTISSLDSDQLSQDFIAWLGEEALTTFFEIERYQEVSWRQGEASVQKVKIPVYRYPYALRKLVATQIGQFTSQFPWRLSVLRDSLSEQLQKHADLILPDYQRIPLRELDDRGQQWLSEQQSLEALL